MALTVATYNLWFGDFAFDRRAQALCDILARSGADVIALQEVTPRFLHILFSQPWIAPYILSVTEPDDINGYGNILMSQLPGSTFERIKLWSYQDRYIHLLHSASGVSLATVHLESKRENQEIRQTQLKEIFTELGIEFSLLVGDCNFDAGSPEEKEIPQFFLDTWFAIHPMLDGYTCDTHINAMAAAQSSRLKQVRYDRIFALQSMWTPIAIERLGTDSLKNSDCVWPSDHFGLLAYFHRKAVL